MRQQGRADKSGSASQKREPISKGVNPGGVDQLGNHVGVARAVTPIFLGPGYKAPMAGTTVHKAGSQGRHR